MPEVANEALSFALNRLDLLEWRELATLVRTALPSRGLQEIVGSEIFA